MNTHTHTHNVGTEMHELQNSCQYCCSTQNGTWIGELHSFRDLRKRRVFSHMMLCCPAMFWPSFSTEYPTRAALNVVTCLISSCFISEHLSPVPNFPYDLSATQSVRWAAWGENWIFPQGLHSRDSAQKSHNGSHWWGHLCHFQVELARKRREGCSLPDDGWLQKQLKLFNICNAYANWCDCSDRQPVSRWISNLPLIAFLLSVHGLVTGSKQDRCAFTLVDVLICPYVTQQNTF